MPKPSSSIPETQVKPEPALENRTRRTYNAEYKMNIIAQADACRHGEVGALLRREKLYSNQLSAWRRELVAGELLGYKKQHRGRSHPKHLSSVILSNLKRPMLA